MQVLLDDDPKLHKAFQKLNATVQFGAKDEGGIVACALHFDGGKVAVTQGPAEKYDLALTFPLGGKNERAPVRRTRHARNQGQHPPSAQDPLAAHGPYDHVAQKAAEGCCRPAPEGEVQPVYDHARALSVYNKAGDPEMSEWCRRQPDRIYQFSVEPYPETGIACYLRVKAGDSKSGHGVYTRRTPFVHFHFLSVEGALKVLLKDVGFVEAVEKGYVETIGSPEYACQLKRLHGCAAVHADVKGGAE